jgi:hypothetical protein
LEADLEIRGEERFGYKVLTVSSAAVPNSIAAICLAMRDEFGLIPHVYFDWTEGSPLIHFLRFILWARARSRRSPARSCAGPNPTGPAARTCTRAEVRPDPATPNYSCVVTGLLCPARVVERATWQRFAVRR